MKRKSPFELHFPENAIQDLHLDYIEGRLGPSRVFYRARVEAIDGIGGQLESNPPNPANSIRARIYTNGLDANLPSEALNVYHPFYPPHIVPPIDVGEHVFVIFEDTGFNSGYWMTPIPVYSDVNYGNPDDHVMTPLSTGDRFEGRTEERERINVDDEYGGNTLQTERESAQRAIFSSNDSIWQGKKVLHIGDSQVAGIYGLHLGTKLREKGATSYVRDGRVSWGVISWLNGRKTPGSERKLTLPQLIQQHQPDIVLITLGGNDASRANSSSYQGRVNELWSQAQEVDKAFWIGPPVRFNGSNSSERHPSQINRERAAQVIQSVAGGSFINSTGVTGTPGGRDRLGVHFTNRGLEIVNRWIDLVVNR